MFLGKTQKGEEILKNTWKF